MKKYLIPNTGNFYKANLHCHSTVSDGSLTPEEIKKEYMSRGYSIVAYTDHEFMIPHHELTDENFLALTGYEMGIEDMSKDWDHRRVCHICAIALSPDITKQVCWDDGYLWYNKDPLIRAQLKYHGDGAYKRYYTHECINDMIRLARENGFFVTYNHPVWSREFSADYLGYHGMHAMEICNYGSIVAGFDDYVPYIYDEILLGGERIYCIATDDNHNHHPKNSSRWDSGGGFTMIKAEKLEYESVAQALLNGHFYASQGPEIKELWFEDGEVHIICSPVDQIKMNYSGRKTLVAADENGTGLTHTSFPIETTESENEFIRLTVTNKLGKPANTNAYFVKELFE